MVTLKNNCCCFFVIIYKNIEIKHQYLKLYFCLFFSVNLLLSWNRLSFKQIFSHTSLSFYFLLFFYITYLISLSCFTYIYTNKKLQSKTVSIETPTQHSIYDNFFFLFISEKYEKEAYHFWDGFYLQHQNR